MKSSKIVALCAIVFIQSAYAQRTFESAGGESFSQQTPENLRGQLKPAPTKQTFGQKVKAFFTKKPAPNAVGQTIKHQEEQRRQQKPVAQPSASTGGDDIQSKFAQVGQTFDTDFFGSEIQQWSNASAQWKQFMSGLQGYVSSNAPGDQALYKNLQALSNKMIAAIDGARENIFVSNKKNENLAKATRSAFEQAKNTARGYRGQGKAQVLKNVAEALFQGAGSQLDNFNTAYTNLNPTERVAVLGGASHAAESAGKAGAGTPQGAKKPTLGERIKGFFVKAKGK